MRADKVYLVGFMAAGKSSLARELGRRLDWQVEDVDERIEAREHRPIAAIFAADGETYFRAVERAVLQELLPPRHVVVATGGGTFVDPRNRELMLRDGLVIWLDVPLATVLERVPADGRSPLACDRGTLEGLYNQRLAAYRLAPVRVDASGGPVDLLVDQIVDGLDI